MKKRRHRKKNWEKLDNTAVLFPAIASEETTNVYRISVNLTEEVDAELLQKALDMCCRVLIHLMYVCRNVYFGIILKQITSLLQRL